jgi:hypothetical protein
MATAPKSLAIAPETAKRGFGQLPCVLCGQETTLTLDLDDLETLHCPECGEDFTRADVEAFLDKWNHVLAWLKAAAELAPAQ